MTTQATHALVIGKFYPPHRGHHLLIDTAAASCDQVSVVVMASTQESVSLASRVAWMRETHAGAPNVTVVGIMDDVPVDYGDPAIWDQHIALMRQALQTLVAPAVTHVFTSESYGAEMAHRFSARSVVLDRGRALVQTSSTKIRRDVVGNWDFLSAPVRAGLAARIVVLGAESSGTTTLSRDLVDRWRRRGGANSLTQWVPEFGREYTVAKLARSIARAQIEGTSAPDLDDLAWHSDEFDLIAQQQQRVEEGAAACGGPVLICDTDVLATAVWHERYIGTWREDLIGFRHGRPPTLYLITHHDGVPFEQDGLRDGEHRRPWMTNRFIAVLDAHGFPYHVLTGSRVERADRASVLIDTVLKRHWDFSTPIVELGK